MAVNRRVTIQADFSSPGQSESARVRGNFNVSIYFASGTPTFDVLLQRSPDEGATWRTVAAADGTKSYTAEAEERGFEPANYYLYRFDCQSVTGGTVGCEINQ